MPDEIFEPEEIVLAGRVLSALVRDGSEEAQASSEHLTMVMDQLVRLREVVTTYTSVIKPHKVAGRKRDVRTLVEAICRSNPYNIEAIIPTRAVVGRAYLVAKFNFLRLLGRVVRHHLDPGQGRDELAAEIDRFVRQAVATIIAEDILISIAGDERLEIDLRRKATFVLADLWEHRTARPVREFFPVLISVWEAKSRFTISYGTLAGTSEMLELMREGCDPAAIDYFTSEHLSEEEQHALTELVFNATYEELEKMRRFMSENGRQVLGPDDVARLFGVPLSRLHLPRTCSSPSASARSTPTTAWCTTCPVPRRRRKST